MTTIKSNTDISQSHKLTEFLPLESADMYYEKGSGIGGSDIVQFGNYADMRIAKNMLGIKTIPCWSFAALFNVMPQINDWITPYGHKDDKLSQFEPKICKIWDHSIIPSYKVTYDNGLSTDIYDNPVDACVDMILKLHELGML